MQVAALIVMSLVWDYRIHITAVVVSLVRNHRVHITVIMSLVGNYVVLVSGDKTIPIENKVSLSYSAQVAQCVRLGGRDSSGHGASGHRGRKNRQSDTHGGKVRT